MFEAIKNKLFYRNRPVIVAFVLYTIVAMVTVLTMWQKDDFHIFFEITISKYVALRPWTAIMYAINMLVMFLINVIYVKNLEILKVKKVLYIIALALSLGCAIFPSNSKWSEFSADLHNIFAYGLMLTVTASICIMLIRARNWGQRVFGIVSVAYAIFFITSFVIVKWEFFIDTIFLWENTFIYLWLGELLIECDESEAVSRFGKYFPIISLVGIGLCWLGYFMAPRNGKSIDDTNPPYWNVMGIVSAGVMICFVIFVLSWMMYLLLHPLSKRKWLDVLLRIVIGIIVIIVVSFVAFLSVFIFGGAGE